MVLPVNGPQQSQVGPAIQRETCGTAGGPASGITGGCAAPPLVYCPGCTTPSPGTAGGSSARTALAPSMLTIRAHAPTCFTFMPSPPFRSHSPVRDTGRANAHPIEWLGLIIGWKLGRDLQVVEWLDPVFCSG